MPLSTKPLPELPVPRRWYVRFLLTVAIVGGASLLRAAVDPLIHDQIPYFIYVAAVVVATWFCGPDAGVFGTVLAAFVGNYLFVPPRYEIVPHNEDWIAMALFSAVALGLVWLVGRWKRAERSLHAHARRLQEQADELRALHTEAERMNRVKDEFLTTLSHELRTPMNAIVGWAYLLDEGRLDAGQRAEAMRVIRRNAEMQLRLIEDLLDVSRIISGKLHLHRAPVDLADVVRSALDAIRPAADAKEIELHTSFAPAALLVGDADRLRQVAWNLLSNAVKFTPKRGRVEVSVEKKDSQIRFAVSDTGIGVDREFFPLIFQRFTQEDGSSTRRHGGLGLGLAIVRHIAELHGGAVRADSAGRGRGTTISLTLPIAAVATELAASDAQKEERRRMKEGEERLTLRGIRVLSVDDEPDARQLVQAALGQYDAEVRTAASAQEAFEELGRWRPDVLLADIGMPEENGYSLLVRVRALSPRDGGQTPAAALTAYAQEEDRERALEAGFQEHVAKPVLPADLARVVARLAGQRRSG